jgi:hypothetical protein
LPKSGLVLKAAGDGTAPTCGSALGAAAGGVTGSLDEAASGGVDFGTGGKLLSELSDMASLLNRVKIDNTYR